MRKLRRGHVRRRSCDLCGWALRIARPVRLRTAPTRTRKGWWPVGLRRRRGRRWRRDFVVGLAGPPQDLVSWWAQDEDFAILYALYLLAVAASAFGVAASLLIRRDFRRSEEAASTTPFRAYLKALSCDPYSRISP